MVCIMMSVIPAASWYLGRVAPRAGFTTAKRQRLQSVLMPAFLPMASLVSTAESLISLPAAGMVSTAPTGRDFLSGTFWVQMSQRAASGLAAPWAMALAVSMALPPPTPIMRSAPNSKASRTPCSAWATVGLGCAPPYSFQAIPAASSDAFTRSNRPLRTTLPLP